MPPKSEGEVSAESDAPDPIQNPRRRQRRLDHSGCRDLGPELFPSRRSAARFRDPDADAHEHYLRQRSRNADPFPWWVDTRPDRKTILLGIAIDDATDSPRSH